MRNVIFAFTNRYIIFTDYCTKIGAVQSLKLCHTVTLLPSPILSSHITDYIQLFHSEPAAKLICLNIYVTRLTLFMFLVPTVCQAAPNCMHQSHQSCRIVCFNTLRGFQYF